MKWEYNVLMVNVANVFSAKPPDDLGVALDERGAEGWELVRVEPILKKGFLGGSYTDKFVLFMKRPAIEG